MKASAFLAKILLLMVFLSMANAGQLYSFQQRVIICMLPLEHADAEQLADVLAPFLSPQGKIATYSPTNTYGRHPIPESLDDVPFDIPKRESFAEFMRTKRELIST